MKECTGGERKWDVFSSPPPLPQTNFYGVPCIPVCPELKGQLKNTPQVTSFLNPQGNTPGLVTKHFTLQGSLRAILSYIKAPLNFNLADLHLFHPLHLGLPLCFCAFSV